MPVTITEKLGYEPERWNSPSRVARLIKQNQNGEWELALPIDPSVTDEERAKYGIPPLSEALSVYKAKYNLK